MTYCYPLLTLSKKHTFVILPSTHVLPCISCIQASLTCSDYSKFKLTSIFAVAPANPNIIAPFKSGQKWLKINLLDSFVKVQPKSLIHILPQLVPRDRRFIFLKWNTLAQFTFLFYCYTVYIRKLDLKLVANYFRVTFDLFRNEQYLWGHLGQFLKLASAQY